MPHEYRDLWNYICDKCDNAGIWQADIELASIIIGEDLEETEALAHFGRRVILLDEGKWFIPSFIEFQYGELRAESKPHLSVIKILTKHEIDPFTLTLKPSSFNPIESFPKGIDTLKDKDKDKAKEKDKEKDKDKDDFDELFETQRDQQNEFKRRCDEIGIHCELEYFVRAEPRSSRFDAAILVNGKLAAIYEFKKYIGREPRTDTKQLARYLGFGFPVFLVKRDHDLDDVIFELQKFLSGETKLKYQVNPEFNPYMQTPNASPDLVTDLPKLCLLAWETWGDSLERHGIPRAPLGPNQERALGKFILAEGLHNAVDALEGFRYEKGSNGFDPAKHATLDYVLKENQKTKKQNWERLANSARAERKKLSAEDDAVREARG